MKINVYRWLRKSDRDWITLAENEISDKQLLFWGYRGKILQFIAGTAAEDFDEPLEIFRWWHPITKDWLTLADGEIPDTTMYSWGYTSKVHQFYASRSPLRNGVQISRWNYPRDGDWVSVSNLEQSDEKMQSWGYKGPINQFYAYMPPNFAPNVEIYPTNISSVMTAFDVTKHSFKFDNNFTLSPSQFGLDFNAWNMGLGGGMCAAALYRFNHKMDLPADTSPPPEKSELYDELFNRQKASLLPNVLPIIYDWQSAPDRSHEFRKHSVGHRTKQEWLQLKEKLDAGIPVIIVLMRVEGYAANPTNNHQVIAIGYNYDDDSSILEIFIYNPNHLETMIKNPGVLTMNLSLPKNNIAATDTSGQRFRGFFVNPNSEMASS